MKNYRRIISFLLAVTALAVLLAGCGGGKTKDVPVSDLADKVCAALGKSDMADPGANYVKGYMKHSPEEIGDYIILKNVIGTNIDEFGIFKAGTMDAAALKTMIEGYIKILQDSWMNYQPEEEPKLKGAEVKTVGDYVMYAILSDADKTTAFKAFETALK
jgi:hypothetical protein